MRPAKASFALTVRSCSIIIVENESDGPIQLGGVTGYNVDDNLAQLKYTLQKEMEQEAAVSSSHSPLRLFQTFSETSYLQLADVSYLECFKGTDLRRTFCAVFPPITQNLTGQNLAGTVRPSDKQFHTRTKLINILTQQYGTYFFALAGQNDPLLSNVITTRTPPPLFLLKVAG